ncbi:MAG: PmoA family protein [Planctomycetota bacterium]
MIRLVQPTCVLLAFLSLAGIALGQEPKVNQNDESAEDAVSLSIKDDQVAVSIGGQPFTSYVSKGLGKPVLYPIYAPGKIPVTRNWPIVKDVEGEAHDHPHHKSMWISHEINGIDFWAEKGGHVRSDSLETEFEGSTSNAIRATSSWLKKTDDSVVLTDTTTFWFGGDSDSRWINCLVTFKATQGDVTFDDTKEGVFAIRTHPDLRLKPNKKQGVTEVFGSAINSEGVAGPAIWGKPAKWVLYYGKIDGQPISIAMFDHPSNLRHPTMWHARDYGLVAANPFGMHHFLGKPKGTGEVTIAKGSTLSLRYRLEIFASEVDRERVEAKWNAFAKQELVELKTKQR